ncbi:MAG: hypothetical protein ACE5H9_06840 [Anaerolineae bacterium]
MGSQRLMLGVGLVVLVFIVLAGILLALLVIQDRQADHYPGALLVSEHNVYETFPQFFIRWDATYRTSDDFPRVYNWYSSGFKLGPERRANSNCVLLEGSSRWFVIVRNTAVLVCDTPLDRMMFVQRSTTLRYR